MRRQIAVRAHFVVCARALDVKVDSGAPATKHSTLHHATAHDEPYFVRSSSACSPFGRKNANAKMPRSRIGGSKEARVRIMLTIKRTFSAPRNNFLIILPETRQRQHCLLERCCGEPAAKKAAQRTNAIPHSLRTHASAGTHAGISLPYFRFRHIDAAMHSDF